MMIVSKWMLEFAGNRWSMHSASPESEVALQIGEARETGRPRQGALHRMSLPELLYFALVGEGLEQAGQA